MVHSRPLFHLFLPIRATEMSSTWFKKYKTYEECRPCELTKDSDFRPFFPTCQFFSVWSPISFFHWKVFQSKRGMMALKIDDTIVSSVLTRKLHDSIDVIYDRRVFIRLATCDLKQRRFWWPGYSARHFFVCLSVTFSNPGNGNCSLTHWLNVLAQKCLQRRLGLPNRFGRLCLV